MSRLEELVKTGEEFEQILYDAMDAAYPGKEEAFCLDIEKRWKAYGMRMLMSEAQWDWITNLAQRG